MPESTSQRLANWATFLGLPVAIVLGIAGLLQSREAQQTADRALTAAKVTEDIENARIAPYIRVDPFAADVELFEAAQLPDARIGMFVHNIDSNSIDMVRLQIYESLSYRDNTQQPIDQHDDGWHQQVDHEFSEVVRAGGLAKVDLKKQLLTQLLQLDLDWSDHPDSVYHVYFNVKCVAKFYGTKTPLGVAIDEDIDPSRIVQPFKFKDRDMISIRWRPSTLPPKAITEFLESYEPAPWVSN